MTRPEQLQVQPLTVSQDASLSVAVIASVAASVADNLGDPETMGNSNPPSKHVNLFDTSIPMKSAERKNFDKNAPEVS